jgi:hypothetical protein
MMAQQYIMLQCFVPNQAGPYTIQRAILELLDIN